LSEIFLLLCKFCLCENCYEGKHKIDSKFTEYLILLKSLDIFLIFEVLMLNEIKKITRSMYLLFD
jgi:hypothetical protein